MLLSQKTWVCSKSWGSVPDGVRCHCSKRLKSVIPSCRRPWREAIDVGLQTLTVAYQNAPTKSLRTQILSIYADRFSANELKRMHQPFENLSDRQIKKARAQAKSEAPVEKIPRYRIRPWPPYELASSSWKSCVCEHDWKSLWQSEEGVGSSLSVIVIRGWKFDWTGCSGHRTLDKCFTASHGVGSS